MSEQATEIVYIPLKAGLDITTGEAKTAWDYVLATIAKQPGLKSFFWGRQVEPKDTIQMVVQWESLDAHAAFASTPEYQPFLDTLDTHIMDGSPTLFHVHLNPANDLTALTQPVTEFVSAYFSPDHSQDEYSANFAEFSSKAAKIPNVAAKGLTGGWSIEPHQHENLGEGVDGKLFAAFIGWPDIEAHMEFRKTEEFKEIIGLLRGGTKGLKMWHVEFQRYV